MTERDMMINEWLNCEEIIGFEEYCEKYYT